MKLVINLLRIAIATQTLLLGFIIVLIITGAKGGPNDYLKIGAYVLIGLIGGLTLWYKREKLPVKTFTDYSILYLVFFLLPAIGLIVLLPIFLGHH